MMNRSISDMQRRGQAYWYEDGLWELVIGLLFVFYAAYYAVVGLLPEDSGAQSIMSIGYVVVVPGAMFVASKVVRRLKDRITTPRTGYVVVSRGRGKIGRTVILALVVGAIAAGGALLVKSLYVPALVGGGGMAVGLGISAHRLGLRRMKADAGIALVTALVVSAVTDDPETAFSLLFGVIGVAVAVLGWVAFARYLRSNPIADDQEAT